MIAPEPPSCELGRRACIQRGDHSHKSPQLHWVTPMPSPRFPATRAAESTLLTKPLVEGATQHVSGFGDVTGIGHGGGSKTSADGPPEEALVDFVSWIQVYLACRSGESETSGPP